jgi:hypothetical protein
MLYFRHNTFSIFEPKTPFFGESISKTITLAPGLTRSLQGPPEDAGRRQAGDRLRRPERGARGDRLGQSGEEPEKRRLYEGGTRQ